MGRNVAFRVRLLNERVQRNRKDFLKVLLKWKKDKLLLRNWTFWVLSSHHWSCLQQTHPSLEFQTKMQFFLFSSLLASISSFFISFCEQKSFRSISKWLGFLNFFILLTLKQRSYICKRWRCQDFSTTLCRGLIRKRRDDMSLSGC